MQNVLLLIATVILLSCNNTPEKKLSANSQKSKSVNKKIKASDIDNSINENTEEYKMNDLEIYFLGFDYTEEYKIKSGFFSLSDFFGYSDHPDSLVIPKQYLKSILPNNKDNFVKLTGVYRNRFLEYNHTKETDSIFVFSCDLDSIKEVSIVAYINQYFDETREIITQDQFVIGFEFDKEQVKIFSDEMADGTNFVYVGKTNPFVKGEIKPILWEKVEDKLFPTNVKPFDPTLYKKSNNMRTSGTYKFETDTLNYFVQMKKLIGGCGNETTEFEGRHFAVINSKNNNVVFEKSKTIECEGDYGSFYSINNKNRGKNDYQWTGAIFKDKPPMIYFNDEAPFGCPSMFFLNSDEPPISIGCDNRH